MKMRLWIAALSWLMVGVSHSFGATGCTLNDPDRDIRRLFPGSTGYRTDFISIEERGGQALADEIETRLGDVLDTRYESLDVPYAYYTVLEGKTPIGRVHGVNQKGMFGGMQLILATDLEGRILAFYFQRISSPEARRFRDEAFVEQFVGLTLGDFYEHAFGPESGNKLSKIASPSEKYENDFKATLRGMRKNLILLDVFHLDSKHDDIYVSYKGG